MTHTYFGPIRLLALAAFGVAGLSACQPDRPAQPAPSAAPTLIESTPLAGRSAQEGQRFRRLSAAATGIDFVNVLRRENTKKYIYNGSGLSVGDYDNDGLPDLFLASLDAPNRLYRQVAPLKFEDVTAAAGLQTEAEWGTGASFFDADGDGDLDLFVCNLAAANRLYINQGDGRFIDEAPQRGLDHVGASVMAAVADYDRDGDLDLYLLTNRVLALWEENPQIKLRLVNGRPTVHPDHVGQYDVLPPDHLVEVGQADILYRNDGQGHFEVVQDSGIAGYDMGLSATWWDYNDDGWPDLYVANDMKTPDHLYRNNRDGSFSDVAPEALPHTSWFSMGADYADIDNDGRMDFLVGDMSATDHFKQKLNMGNMGDSGWFLEWAVPRQYMRNALYRNTGTPHFQEIAFMAGLASTDWTWAVRFGDLDNDGREDLFISNGMERAANDSDWNAKVEALSSAGRRAEAAALILDFPRQAEPNLAFRNVGNLRFDPVGQDWGLADESVSHGASLVDLDRDGDLDVIVNNLNEEVAIYENRSGRGNAVLIELHDPRTHGRGVGARLRLRSASGSQIRHNYLSRGYMTGEEALVHFGLGDDALIQELQIEWPGGQLQRFRDLAVNQRYRITAPAGPVAPQPQAPKRARYEQVALAGLDFLHRERPFDDFAKQPLLPNRLSTPGPAQAWGDYDGDGLPDVWLGGAAGQSGALYRNLGGFRFELMADAPWQQDAESEDTDAAWLDFDGDGRLDLYVVSGGVEAGPGANSYRDRLYLNRSSGFVAAKPEQIASDTASGSVVAAADFDRDGDVDLFVGARVVPGAYPQSSASRLLRNDRGRLVEIQNLQLGMVTAASWLDVTGDGWLDLVVAGEWEPVRLLENQAGSMSAKLTAPQPISQRGWWGALAGGDVDGDGDIDLVVTNTGLNTKYRASPAEPARLYLADFDNSGAADLVEAGFEHGHEFPVRGRSCSSAAMPFIGEKFPTFRSFAAATLPEIFPGERLAGATVFEAETLESQLLLNDGSGGFVAQSLPREAQLAPALGVVLADLNQNGRLDLALSQNFYGPQPETGRWAGGVGLLLEGQGNGRFEPLAPAVSGLVAADDGRSIRAVDIDGDGVLELALVAANGPLRVFRRRIAPGSDTAHFDAD